MTTIVVDENYIKLSQTLLGKLTPKQAELFLFGFMRAMKQFPSGHSAGFMDLRLIVGEAIRVFWEVELKKEAENELHTKQEI